MIYYVYIIDNDAFHVKYIFAGLIPPLPGLVRHRTFDLDQTKRSDIF